MISRVAIFFLHGSGDNGNNFKYYLETIPLTKQFNYQTFKQILLNQKDYHYELYTPSSPIIPYSPAGGEKHSVWYDRSPDFKAKGINDIEDIEGTNKSLQQIINHIKSIEDLYEHIFVGGFSMGGGLALHCLRYKISSKIRGIFTMGSFLVQHSLVLEPSIIDNTTTDEKHEKNNIPILMLHGESDGLIDCDWGRKTAANLLINEFDVQFRTFSRLDHALSPEELSDLIEWIKDILYSTNKATSLEYDDNNKQGTHDVKHIHTKVSDSKSSNNNDDCKYNEKESSIHEHIDNLYISNKNTLQLPTTRTKASSKENNDKDGLPFQIEYIKKGTISQVIIHYNIPKELVKTLISKPILACGSVFELQQDNLSISGGILVHVQSINPHNTAIEIGKRLQARISSEGNSYNACPMS